eukprot:1147263-Lingulodinium_polyedra.AAC.1
MGGNCGQGVAPQPGSKIATLLQWFHNRSTEQSLALCRALLVWMVEVLESSPALSTASDDPLQAPAPKGPERTRVIDRDLKEAVAQAVAQGALGESHPAGDSYFEAIQALFAPPHHQGQSVVGPLGFVYVAGAE